MQYKEYNSQDHDVPRLLQRWEAPKDSIDLHRVAQNNDGREKGYEMQAESKVNISQTKSSRCTLKSRI